MLQKLTKEPDNEFKTGHFVLWAYRYGSKQLHSYPVGIYKTLETAKHNAKCEAIDRGGKYSVVIYATRGNSLFEIYEVPSPYSRQILNGEIVERSEIEP